MKKLTFLAAIVIIALSIFATNDAKAQCSAGENSYNFIYTTPTGCHWSISICYMCETIGTANPLHWRISGFAPLDTACADTLPNINDIIRAIYQEGLDHNLCTYPPCTEGTHESYLDAPVCLAKFTTLDIPARHYISNCAGGSSAYCRHHFQTCVDYSTNPPFLHLTETSIEPIGTPTCPDDAEWPMQGFPGNCYKAFPCN